MGSSSASFSTALDARTITEGEGFGTAPIYLERSHRNNITQELYNSEPGSILVNSGSTLSISNELTEDVVDLIGNITAGYQGMVNSSVSAVDSANNNLSAALQTQQLGESALLPDIVKYVALGLLAIFIGKAVSKRA